MGFYDDLNVLLQKNLIFTVSIGLLEHLHRDRTIKLRNTNVIEYNLVQSAVDLDYANLLCLLVACFTKLGAYASVSCHWFVISIIIKGKTNRSFMKIQTNK